MKENKKFKNIQTKNFNLSVDTDVSQLYQHKVDKDLSYTIIDNGYFLACKKESLATLTRSFEAKRFKLEVVNFNPDVLMLVILYIKKNNINTYCTDSRTEIQKFLKENGFKYDEKKEQLYI